MKVCYINEQSMEIAEVRLIFSSHYPMKFIGLTKIGRRWVIMKVNEQSQHFFLAFALIAASFRFAYRGQFYQGRSYTLRDGTFDKENEAGMKKGKLDFFVKRCNGNGRYLIAKFD